MSKEEFLKIQTCVLKVNIHCDGCKHKVKKILQKIDGVYTVKIDAEQGKVSVSGNLDPHTLIKKLVKSGKHAEIWGSKPAMNFQNQFQNMLIDTGKGGNKNQKGGGNIPQLKGNGGGSGGPPNLLQLQQLQQQMKGFQDLKLPQPKDMKGSFKLPTNQNQNNKKSVKFELDRDDEDMTDDEFGDLDEDDDEFDEDDDEFEDDESEDEMDDKHHHQLNKLKPVIANGSHGPNLIMMNGQAKQGGFGDPFGGAAGKKGGNNGGRPLPVQINGIGKHSAGGKQGGGGSNGTTNGGNHGHGSSAKSGGKKGGGEFNNVNTGGGGDGHNKNGHNGSRDGNLNGAKKGGAQPMIMGDQMGNMSMPAGYMLPSHARPTATMSAGGGGGYSHGSPPEGMRGNQHQQQMAAAMMNQQRAMGNERFQPMMYSRPPPEVNYAPPPYPYPYPYPHQHPQAQYPPPQDSYTQYIEESTSSCSVM